MKLEFADMIIEIPSQISPKYFEFEDAKNQIEPQHKKLRRLEENEDKYSSFQTQYHLRKIRVKRLRNWQKMKINILHSEFHVIVKKLGLIGCDINKTMKM